MQDTRRETLERARAGVRQIMYSVGSRLYREPIGPEVFDKDGNEVGLPAWLERLAALAPAPSVPANSPEQERLRDEAMGIYSPGSRERALKTGPAAKSDTVLASQSISKTGFRYPRVAPPKSGPRTRSPAQMRAALIASCGHWKIRLGKPCMCGEH